MHFSSILSFLESPRKKQIALKIIFRSKKLKFVDIVRIKTGLKGIQSLKKNIQKCDAIIDLTYGDSFSDIYGMKNFVLYSVPKLVTEKLHIPLILGPQTYGPFKSKMARKFGKKDAKKDGLYFCQR